jgi:glycyl-tRNA synthetase
MSQNSDEIFKKVISHSKEYGFVFQSSEIYDGLSSVYDYGPNGSLLKNNLKNFWWRSMVQLNENIVGIDSAIFMHPNVWKASGHIQAFSDPLIDNKDSKKRYRADILVEEFAEKLFQKAEKEIKKAAARFGDSFDSKLYRKTNSRVLEYESKAKSIMKRFSKALKNDDLKEAHQVIIDEKIKCPISGSANWTEIRHFNLMFGTKIGSVADEANDLFLRPETAQGIFTNFLNVVKTSRLKVPFGIAQIGKAFRNEIVARQFIFRMREFEQMEMQFFIKPGDEKKWFEYWKKSRMDWHKSLGFKTQNYRYHDHEKLAHYANAASDIEYKFPFGFKELEGIHSRTDFDLKQHSKESGKKLQIFDPELNDNFTPSVIETSIGLDRMFLSVMSECLDYEILEDNSSRVVLRLPYSLAPNQAAILPLLKKDGLPEYARKVYDNLKFDFQLVFDEKDAIGKRYRRQDAIGTPLGITIDHQTLKDDTVTIRDRDSMQQKRVNSNDLNKIISSATSIEALLKKR